MGYIKKTDEKKPWAIRTANVKRTTRNLEVRNIFTIYCEGVNTEPEYFKCFPVNTETKVEAIGLGRSKSAMVENVIERLNGKQQLIDQKDFDPDRQIWCVFDFDRKGEQGESEDFDNAVRLAKENGIKVAYSNDSFELWFILHYQYLDAALTRKEFYDILSKHLGWNYEKEGKKSEVSKSFFGILYDKMETAIDNAEKLAVTHKGTSKNWFFYS
jgi:hypothetical protein